MMPMVLLHAFPQTAAMWKPLAAHLVDHFQVITPNLPGFGDAPPAPGWTCESAADQIVEHLNTAGHDRAIVGGCSMGGYVALAFARRHPDRLAGLILMNTRAEADTPEARASRGENLKLVAEKGTEALIEKMLPRLLGEASQRDRPELTEQVRHTGAAQSPEAVIAGLIALRDRPDVTPSLANITAPTLVIAGEEDELIPADSIKTLRETIPDAVLVTIPACGHLSPWEAPAVVAEAIRMRFRV